MSQEPSSHRSAAAGAADVVATAQALRPSGLGVGTSGNVSIRAERGFLITPSGVPYADLSPSDVVLVDFDGAVVEGTLEPSSEWRIHRDIYVARSDVGAIVHAHPPAATALACTRRELPAIHYMIAAAGGATIRCAPYATFGTEELSAHVVRALEDRRACLMENHGIVATGPSCDRALALAVEVEALAEIYLRVLAVGGGVILSDREMGRVVERFASYGTKNRARGA